jgi:hypothetical protein
VQAGNTGALTVLGEPSWVHNRYGREACAHVDYVDSHLAVFLHFLALPAS